MITEMQNQIGNALSVVSRRLSPSAVKSVFSTLNLVKDEDKEKKKDEEEKTK